jgi:hypothetical protein
VSGTGTGLRGDYYAGRTLSTLVMTRNDATVNFDWGSGGPGNGVASDNFSVRWSGQVSPRFGGATTFHTRSDDGVRLWIDGQLVIDNWTDHAPAENSASVTLTAGQRYDLKLEYYENGGGAVAQLSWSHACESKRVIPAAQLYPAAVAADPAQYGFESGAQGWSTSGGALTSVASSNDRAFAGSRSLKLDWNGGAGAQRALVRTPATPAGATVTFRVYLPAGAAIASLQPYVLQGSAGGWAWTGAWRGASSLASGQWNTITVQVPTAAKTPLAELGVELTTSASWTGAVYVDSIAW